MLILLKTDFCSTNKSSSTSTNTNNSTKTLFTRISYWIFSSNIKTQCILA